MDYTKGDIKEHTGIKQADLLRDFPNLLAHSVIIETRRIRGEPLYRLNMANPATQAILTFKDAMAGDVMVVDDLAPCLPECSQHDANRLELETEQPDMNEPEHEEDQEQEQESIPAEHKSIVPNWAV